MDTCLVNRNSPIRSGIAPKLRYRSRNSESDSGAHHGSGDESRSFQHSNGTKEGTSSFNGNKEDQKDDEPQLEDSSVREETESKSMLGYFMSELTRGYKLEADASEFVQRRDRIYTSVNTPKNLEKFCAFGFLQCMDSILFMVTFLPLRILFAIIRVITYPFTVLFVGRSTVLDAGQICDLLKGIILVVSCTLTGSMDMSMIYHIVRGQSIIKFYVFYNMLDVMDKLISGFGQDVLDSLYWTAVEPRGRKREHFGTIFHLIFAIVYVVIHTMMILMQAIILNVAFNSHNKNLLTIMMSNNFVEIKGNLFKRLDKSNLCQITYSDVKERFHYLVLLLFVFIRNMTELQWSWEMAFPILQDSFIVLLVEMIVDWIKHAFITKFNELSASSYADFALGLAQDIASSKKKHAFTNFSDQVCRRMGFTPMPLICLLFMVCSKSFDFSGYFSWILVGMFYLCLISSKVLISIILLGWAQRLISEKNKNAKATGTVVNSQVVPKKEEKRPVEPPPVVLATVPSSIIYGIHPSAASSSFVMNTATSVGTSASACVSASSLESDLILSDTLPTGSLKSFGDCSFIEKTPYPAPTGNISKFSHHHSSYTQTESETNLSSSFSESANVNVEENVNIRQNLESSMLESKFMQSSPKKESTTKDDYERALFTLDLESSGNVEGSGDQYDKVEDTGDEGLSLLMKKVTEEVLVLKESSHQLEEKSERSASSSDDQQSRDERPLLSTDIRGVSLSLKEDIDTKAKEASLRTDSSDSKAASLTSSEKEPVSFNRSVESLNQEKDNIEQSLMKEEFESEDTDKNKTSTEI